MKKCCFPDGLTIKPNGMDELDPCRYEVVERYRNVTVEIGRCKKCGHTDITWFRQEDTIDDMEG